MSSTVIGGAMLPHAPQFFTMPETEDRKTVERVRTWDRLTGSRRRSWRISSASAASRTRRARCERTSSRIR